MEQENNFWGKEKKHGEGKGGCIYNINNWRSKIFFLWKRRNTEKKKEENIWRRNIFSLGEWRFDGCTITCDAMCLKYQESKFYQSPGVEKLLTNSQSALGLISISYLRKHSQTVSTNDSPKATKMQAFSSSFQYLDEITSLRPLRHIGDGSINCYK